MGDQHQRRADFAIEFEHQFIDLSRIGLAWQTVMDGQRPFHEPMRMLTLIEAPREQVLRIIGRHRFLQRLYDNEWVHLAVFEPEEKVFYRYFPQLGWTPIKE